MSGFIFPFASVQDQNNIFNYEKLQFHYFNSLIALPIHNEIVTNHIPVDNIDKLLCNNSDVKCEYFQANEFISLLHVLKSCPYCLVILMVHLKISITFVLHTSIDSCPALLPSVKQSLILPLNIYILSVVILVSLTAGITKGEEWQCMQELTFHSK